MSNKESVWLSPCGRVFEFFTAGFAGRYPLATSLADGAAPLLKAQACETADGGLMIYLVNLATEPRALAIALPSGYHPGQGETLFAPDRLSRITRQKCDVRNERLAPAANGNWLLPPLSVTKLRAFRRSSRG